MARNNIFELLKQNCKSFEDNLYRIDTLFQKRNMVTFHQMPVKTFTLKDFVQQECFYKWKNRGNCIDVDDFLCTIGYPIESDETVDLYSYLNRIEGVYNLWYLAKNYFNSTCYTSTIELHKPYNLLPQLLDDCLSEFNFKAHYNKKEQQLIICEDKPEVTAVAEIVKPEIALEILRYNHHTLQNNIIAKKRILLTMGEYLEPKRPDLNKIDQKLEDRVFFLLNNLNLRHNNCTEGGKNFKEKVATMNSKRLEYWYDQLYQMILLATLELDNVERMREVDKLKKEIEVNKRTNG